MRTVARIENKVRISEIAKRSGVTKPTIHYYVQEGLLLPPLKTSRNMAYYDLGCVSEIHLIKELQTKRHLPLSAIKLMMKARRECQEPSHIAEMGSLLEAIFCPIDQESEVEIMTGPELVEITNLPKNDLLTLENMGLIALGKTIQDRSNLDICIIGIVKKLSEFGVKLTDLRVYCQFLKVIQQEAEKMHSMLHELPNRDQLPVYEIYSKLNDLKTCLTIKALRQVAQEYEYGNEEVMV